MEVCPHSPRFKGCIKIAGEFFLCFMVCPVCGWEWEEVMTYDEMGEAA